MTASFSETIPERTPIAQLETGIVRQSFLVASSEVKEAKNGKAFVRLTLVDRTGELSAIWFDQSTAPEPGVYEVHGALEEWNGGLQFKVRDVSALDGVDPSEFVPASRFHPDHLRRELREHIDALGGEVGEVVRAVFDDAEIFEAFLEAPAAKANHHAFDRGLAEHVLSMCDLAGQVADHYGRMYGVWHPIDRDLLLAGVLLHDLGKVRDYQRVGFAWEMSAHGELVGHIAECATLIHDACMATLASDDTRRRLMHVVLAHHGRLEYGSPVTPRLIEAQLLHLVDMMDSRFAMFLEATQGLEAGEFSGWVRPLGGRVGR